MNWRWEIPWQSRGRRFRLERFVRPEKLGSEGPAAVAVPRVLEALVARMRWKVCRRT